MSGAARESRHRRVEVALRQSSADLVVQDCRLLDVYTGQIVRGGIAVVDGVVARTGDLSGCTGADTAVVDGRDRIAVPGLIDGHIHTYESHLPPSELARGLLRHGVTTIVTDFYGEAVVAGVQAVRASLDEALHSPLNVVFLLPMPALYQDEPFLHTRTIGIEEMVELANWPECHGLNECFAKSLLAGEPQLAQLVDLVQDRGGKICGHGSELSSDESQAWSAYVGAVDDHEAVGGMEAIEKLRAGIHIIAREGSGVANVRDIVSEVIRQGVDTRRISFCTDLISPVDLLQRGSIDECVRIAVAAGADAVSAVRMATLNGAECHRIDDTCGAIAPGRRADIVLLAGPLEEFDVESVIAGGRLVVRDHNNVEGVSNLARPAFATGTVRIPEVGAETFALAASTMKDSVRARVIGVVEGSIITDELERDLPVRDGHVAAEPSRGVLKIAAIERHGRTGKIGVGFVEGFGLRSGAVASTYNPHCQHLLVAGATDQEMALAVEECARMDGGFVVVDGDAVLARVPLPLYGLLSTASVDDVASQIEHATAMLHRLGCKLAAPFHALAFSGLPVAIGRLKISSVGLIDVWAAEPVPVVIR